MLYNTRHLCEIFQISPSSVKNWADSYAPYLSETAKPGDNRHRAFTTDDLKVFAYVVEQKHRNISHDEIFLALANGARGELPSVVGEYSLSMDSREQVSLLQNRVMQLSAEIERLKPFEREAIESSALLKKAELSLTEAQEKIDRLNREIGRLGG